MSDYRSQLIQAISESLVNVLDPDTHDTVTNKIITVLSDYEVTKRCTELIVHDDINERLMKRYCACLMIDGKSEKTIRLYNGHLRRFLEFVRKPATDVGVYDIRFYLATKKEGGAAASTLENTRTIISAFYTWMHNDEIIEKNPCATLKAIKCPKIERLPFSTVEVDSMRHACKTLKERAIFELLLSSGVRCAELENLDISDIDMAKNTVRVRNGKGGKDRTTYMSDVAKAHLQKYLLGRKDSYPALFVSAYSDRMSGNGIRYVLNTLAERSGVRNVHPHRFRRTFATSLASSGMALQEIQTLMGHSEVNTTLRYVHTEDKSIRASYEKHIA